MQAVWIIITTISSGKSAKFTTNHQISRITSKPQEQQMICGSNHTVSAEAIELGVMRPPRAAESKGH
jgi:hypothetical protein